MRRPLDLGLGEFMAKSFLEYARRLRKAHGTNTFLRHRHQYPTQRRLGHAITNANTGPAAAIRGGRHPQPRRRLVVHSAARAEACLERRPHDGVSVAKLRFESLHSLR